MRALREMPLKVRAAISQQAQYMTAIRMVARPELVRRAVMDTRLLPCTTFTGCTAVATEAFGVGIPASAATVFYTVRTSASAPSPSAPTFRRGGFGVVLTSKSKKVPWLPHPAPDRVVVAVARGTGFGGGLTAFGGRVPHCVFSQKVSQPRLAGLPIGHGGVHAVRDSLADPVDTGCPPVLGTGTWAVVAELNGSMDDLRERQKRYMDAVYAAISSNQHLEVAPEAQGFVVAPTSGSLPAEPIHDRHTDVEDAVDNHAAAQVASGPIVAADGEQSRHALNIRQQCQTTKVTAAIRTQTAADKRVPLVEVQPYSVQLCCVVFGLDSVGMHTGSKEERGNAQRPKIL